MTAADTSRTLATTATEGLGAGLSERAIQVEAAKVHALLAVAEAVGRLGVQRPRWDDDLRAHPPVCIAPRGDGILCTLDLGHEGDHAWPRGNVTWARATAESPSGSGQERPNTTGPVPEATPPIPSPEQADSAPCRNCDDRQCMACVFREVHDECEHSCPDCGPRPVPVTQMSPVPTRVDFLRVRSVVEQLDRLREGIRDAVDILDGPVNPEVERMVHENLRALLADDPTHTHPITVAGQPAEERGKP